MSEWLEVRGVSFEFCGFVGPCFHGTANYKECFECKDLSNLAAELLALRRLYAIAERELEVMPLVIRITESARANEAAQAERIRALESVALKAAAMVVRRNGRCERHMRDGNRGRCCVEEEHLGALGMEIRRMYDAVPRVAALRESPAKTETPVRGRYYRARCVGCGYTDSSEMYLAVSYGDDADVVCPKCGCADPEEVPALPLRESPAESEKKPKTLGCGCVVDDGQKLIVCRAHGEEGS